MTPACEQAITSLSLWLVAIFLVEINVCNCQSQIVLNAKGVQLERQNSTAEGVCLHTSSDIIVRVGEHLQLNCTVIGAGNSSKYQLSWYHGTQKLGNNVTTKLKNRTLQVNIDHVDWKDNGTYSCKETTITGLEPGHVEVIVGDIPSSPQNVWTNNVDFNPVFHWTAPVYLGGLPLRYLVKGQCFNVTRPDVPDCEEASILCKSSHVRSGPETKTFMCTSPARLVQGIVSYAAIVEVWNALGFNRSSPVEFKANQLDSLSTTPQPASSFTAKEVEPATTVKLSWEDARQFRYIFVKYTILYHKEGDKQNKSVIVYSPQVYVLIPDLFGFTRYIFYLLVQYGYKSTKSFGTYSKAVMQTILTSIFAPSRHATITNCSQWHNFSSDPQMLVTWEFPPSEYWNGPLKFMNISYRCQRGSYKTAGSVSLINSTAQSVAIPGIQPAYKCSVWMRICNTPQLCSAISNICVKPAKPEDKRSLPSRNSDGSVLQKVIIILVGTVGGIALVITVIKCVQSRRRKERQLQPSLDMLEVTPPIVHGYDEIEEPLVNNNYEVLHV